MALPKCHIYTRSLVKEGHGLPFWIPEPDARLPEEYLARGVWIGDVLILEEDGGYDYMFNILASADNPINQGRVPEGFIPLSFDPKEISERGMLHPKGAVISSIQVSQIRLNADAAVPIVP